MAEQLVVARAQDPIVEAAGRQRDTRPGRRRPASMPANASAIEATSSSVRTSGRQARGERLDRQPHLGRLLVQAPVVAMPPTRQLSTSGSRMFHSARARTRVPVFGRASTRPFAARTRTASRSTVRLTARFDVRSSSGGSGSPGSQVTADDLQADRVHDFAVQTAARVGRGPVTAYRRRMTRS